MLTSKQILITLANALIKNTNNKSGFTLIELAILLLVLSFAAVSALTTEQYTSGLGNNVDTSKKLLAIKAALNKYAVTNSKYPCPAQGALATTNASYGAASGSPGSCTSGVTVSGGSCDTATGKGLCLSSDSSVVVGTVPFKVLGLTDNDVMDAWGNRILYAVKMDNTTSTSNQGGITILSNRDTAQLETHVNQNQYKVTQYAAYALISYGPNGIGAYMNSGSATRVAGTASSYEDANSHTLTPTAWNNVFLKMGQAPSSSSIVFDDLVEWQEGTAAVCAAGSEATLPVVSTGTLKYHLDASDVNKVYTSVDCTTGNNPSNGALIRCVKEADGKTIYAMAVIASYAPTYTTNQLNGRSVLTFDGTDALQTFADTGYSTAPWGASPLVQPNTIFIVGRRTTIAPGDYNNYYIDGLISSARHNVFTQNASGEMRVRAGGTTTGSISDSASSAAIHTILFNDNPVGTDGTKYWRNGVEIVSTNGDSGSSNLTGLTIGAEYAPTSIDPDVGSDKGLIGYIAEILVYNGALSNADREAVELYLARKWFLEPHDGAGNTTANMTLWLDATATTTTLFTGSGCTGAVTLGTSTIGCWKDRLGSGYDAIQATAGNRPTSAAHGSYYGIYFDSASSKFLSNSTYQHDVPTASIFAIGTLTDNTSTYRPVITNNYNFYLGCYGEAKGASFYGDGSAWGAGFQATSCMDNLISQTISSVIDGENNNYQNMGTSTAGGGTSGEERAESMSALGASDYGYSVGKDNITSSYWKGTITDIIMYECPLTEAERTRVECYLNYKWKPFTSTLFGETCE